MKLASFFVLQIVAFCSVYGSSYISKQLAQIPAHDLASIEDYFKSLYQTGDFTFTLFGVKPMGSTTHSLDRILYIPNNRAALIDLRGMKTWERYAHLFPLKQFIFITLDSIAKNGCYDSVLINRVLCASIISEHAYLFEQLYGTEVTPDQIMQRLGHGDYGREDLLVRYKALGLLYGYPKQAIEDFYTSNQLCSTLASLPISGETLNEEYIHRVSRIAHQQPLIDTLYTVEKLNTFMNTFAYRSYFKPHPLFPIKVHGYMSSVQGDDSRYKDVIPQIMRLANSKTFLEDVLTLLSL